MTQLAEIVKEAARSDLRALAQEAGFRPARGKKFHCIGHKDRTASAHLYSDRMQRFCCGDNLDAIDLAQIIINGSPGQAIKWLAARYGVRQESGMPPEPRFSEADHIQAELFRTGFSWALERYLALLKQAWAQDEAAVQPHRIANFTKLLNRAHHWNAFELARFFSGLRSRKPAFVQACISEATEAQFQFARIIAAAGHTIAA